jgi:hypothetical protein
MQSNEDGRCCAPVDVHEIARVLNDHARVGAIPQHVVVRRDAKRAPPAGLSVRAGPLTARHPGPHLRCRVERPHRTSSNLTALEQPQQAGRLRVHYTSKMRQSWGSRSFWSTDVALQTIARIVGRGEGAQTSVHWRMHIRRHNRRT